MPRWWPRRRRGRPGSRPGAGDGPFHVALMLDNVPEFVFWLEAAALAGAVVVGANPTHRGDELVRDLSHTECQFLVTDSTYLPLVEGARIGDALGEVRPANERVLVLDTDQAQRTLAGVRLGRRRDGGRPIRDTRHAGLPPLHLGHLRRAQGVPVQPGTVGAHRRHRGPDVRAPARGRLLPLHAPLPLQRAHGRLGPGAHGGLGQRAPLVGPVLRLGLPARRAGGRRHLLQLRRQAAVLHSGHARATRRRRQPAGARLRQRGNDRRRGPLRRALRRRRHRLLRLDRRAAPRCSGPPTPRRGRWGGRPRAPSSSTRRPAPSARRPASTNAGGCSTPRRPSASWCPRPVAPASRATGATAKPRRPACARAGTGRATWPTATRPASSTSPDGTTTGCGSTGRTSPRLRLSASCSVTPTSCWRRSTPCPTPSWATRSWRRCSCGPVSPHSTGRSCSVSWPPRVIWAPSGRPASCA